LQVGAELYGHSGIESDVEVQRLMMKALAVARVPGPCLDIGHVGIFRAVLAHARVDSERESELFRAMQAKDRPALRGLARGLDRVTREALVTLPELYGGVEVLERARRVLPDYPGIRAALRQLRDLSAELRDVAPVRCFDLAELRGYRYHSGMVFAAYADGVPDALALGGRYDEVGKAFGRARPATGFSMDLRQLAALRASRAGVRGILAPYAPRDAGLQKAINALREKGEIVIVDLPGHAGTREELGCDRRLARRAGRWRVTKWK
jgi:ATP phosphoribosyltransferase regulatory subunit